MPEKSIWERTEGLPQADRVRLAGSMVATQAISERQAKKRKDRAQLWASVVIVLIVAVIGYFLLR